MGITMLLKSLIKPRFHQFDLVLFPALFPGAIGSISDSPYAQQHQPDIFRNSHRIVLAVA